LSDQTIQGRNPDRDPGSGTKVLHVITTAVGTLFSLCLIVVFCYNFILSSGTKETVSQQKAAGVTIMDKYDMYVNNAIADSLDGFVVIEKVYWLSDHDQVAPEPNPECYGEVSSYEELLPVLKKAEGRLRTGDLFYRLTQTHSVSSFLSEDRLGFIVPTGFCRAGS
jgi:hypothetical protein